MKKKSPPYAILAAFVLACIGAYAFYLHEKKQKADMDAAVAAERAKMDQAVADAGKNKVTVTSAPIDMRNVLYATQPVEPGVRISPAFYEKKPTPKNILPSAISDQTDITGWFAIRKIEKGDPITTQNVNKTPAKMSERLPVGMRALALKVFNGSDVNNTGGFAVDGDHVDLFYTVMSTTNAVRTQLVMPDIKILYIPGPAQKSDDTQGITPAPAPGETLSVTFEVTPEQAQILTLMSQDRFGRFSMMLRPQRDDTTPKLKTLELGDFAGNFQKLERISDKSIVRVKKLAEEIKAKEKLEDQGNANETTTPTPPNP